MVTPHMHSIIAQDIPYQAHSEILFCALRDLPDAIWLDSGKPHSSQGCFDIISACPDVLIETYGAGSTVTDSKGSRTTEEDPFALAEQLLEPLLAIDDEHAGQPFVGGILGYFGYDLGRRLVDIPDHTLAVSDLPDMRIGRYLWSLVIDHSKQRSQLFFHGLCPPSLQRDIIARLTTAIATAQAPSFKLKGPFKATLSKDQYRAAINRIKEYIVSGDCYQTNFTQHFSAPYQGDVWEAYLALREAAPSPYSGFWQWRDKAILCISPERFLKCAKGSVETKPIKGTILRGKSAEEDKDNANMLINSAKDRAENVMIVDLLRNDISKNCQAGTVRVPALFALESFANVHHLVSTVTGVLNKGRNAIDLLKGCFPGGSITGAPKNRAMEIIEELEPVKRSVYCGSLGYISANGVMDTNIAIRTLVADDSTLHCWGGGGIVADSEADNEYDESLNKIRLLLDTLENRT